jgi:hypothetical protein
MSNNTSTIIFNPEGQLPVEFEVWDNLIKTAIPDARFWVTYLSSNGTILNQEEHTPTVITSTVATGSSVNTKLNLELPKAGNDGKIIIEYASSPSFTEADPDLEQYFNAVTINGGILASYQKAAIRKFVKRAKAAGYWNHLIEVGPIIGENLAAAQVKLKFDQNISNLLNFDTLNEADYSAVSGVGESLFPLNFQPRPDGRIIRGVSLFAQRGSTYTFGSGTYLDPVLSLLADSPGYVQWHIGNRNEKQIPIFLYGRSNWDYANNPYSPFYHAIKQDDNKNTIYINGEAKATSEVYDPVDSNRTQFPLTLKVISGQVWMYCIDDGGFSDVQVVQFNEHMHLLMYDLNRLEKPPVIHARTTVNEPQTILFQ